MKRLFTAAVLACLAVIAWLWSQSAKYVKTAVNVDEHTVLCVDTIDTQELPRFEAPPVNVDTSLPMHWYPL